MAASKDELINVARKTLPLRHLAAASEVRLVLCDGEPAADLKRLDGYGQMIAVGRRRLPVADRLFNGSVSRHLVASADRPVVIVPDSGSPLRHRGPIVVGVSASQVASTAVSWAARRAVRRNQELILVCSVADQRTGEKGGARELHGGRHREESTVLLDRAASLARKGGGPALRLRQESRSGPAESTLIEACTDASLLVLGKDRVTWPHHRVGFVADHVLRAAELPIAVIPAETVVSSP